jgi:hypothetical protein
MRWELRQVADLSAVKLGCALPLLIGKLDNSAVGWGLSLPWQPASGRTSRVGQTRTTTARGKRQSQRPATDGQCPEPEPTPRARVKIN